MPACLPACLMANIFLHCRHKFEFTDTRAAPLSVVPWWYYEWFLQPNRLSFPQFTVSPLNTLFGPHVGRSSSCHNGGGFLTKSSDCLLTSNVEKLVIGGNNRDREWSQQTGHCFPSACHRVLIQIINECSDIWRLPKYLNFLYNFRWLRIFAVSLAISNRQRSLKGKGLRTGCWLFPVLIKVADQEAAGSNVCLLRVPGITQQHSSSPNSMFQSQGCSPSVAQQVGVDWCGRQVIISPGVRPTVRHRSSVYLFCLLCRCSYPLCVRGIRVRYK